MTQPKSIPTMSARPSAGLCLAAVLLAILAASPAAAQLDTDPANDAAAGADDLGLGPGMAVANLADLAGGSDDVDYYSTLLLTGDVWLGMTTPLFDLPHTYDVPDTMASVFASGVPQTFNDDDAASELPAGGANRASLFRFLAPGTGTYHVGVTGFGDEEFDGATSGLGHTEAGPYALITGRVNPAVLGGDFVDTDPTNDFPFSPAPVPDGVADVIPISKGMASVAVAELLANDVDFYALHLFAGQVLSAMTAPLADLDATFDAPDTRIALFGGTPSGIRGYPYLEKFVENEDAGNFEESDLYPDLGSDNPFEPFGVFGSAIRALIPEDGVYYLAVSGFGDSDYSGSHDDEGRYALLVGVVLPEPGTLLLALIGAVGLCLTGRRMSRPEGAKACSQGR